MSSDHPARPVRICSLDVSKLIKSIQELTRIVQILGRILGFNKSEPNPNLPENKEVMCHLRIKISDMLDKNSAHTFDKIVENTS